MKKQLKAAYHYQQACFQKIFFIKTFVLLAYCVSAQTLFKTNNPSAFSNKLVEGKLWYSKEGRSVNESDNQAYYYELFTITRNQVQHIVGTRQRELLNAGYIKKANEYFFQGKLTELSIEGRLMTEGEFKEGIPTKTYQAWYPSGKPKVIVPVNGTMNFYSEDGKVLQEGPMVNGLGNGDFYDYEKGVKTAEWHYKNGKLAGLQKQFEDGELSKEFFIDEAYEVQSPIIEDLQVVKIKEHYGYVDRSGKLIIAANYANANTFNEGVALVSDDDKKDFFINKSGKKLTDEEVKESKRNWKPNVKVYANKAEIVSFLKKIFSRYLITFEKTYVNHSIVITEKSISIFNSLITREAAFSDILGVKLYPDTRKIGLIGRFKESGNTTDKWPIAIISLDSSVVGLKMAIQVRENLRQLAVLNGADLLAEKTPVYSKEQVFDFLKKATEKAKGYLNGDNKSISSVSFSTNQYSITLEGSKTESSTGMDWDKIWYIVFKEFAELVEFDIYFLPVGKKGERKEYPYLIIYVRPEDLNKTIIFLQWLTIYRAD